MASGLAWSLKNGDLDEVKSGITDSNVNSNIDGRKPLHYAADYGHNDVIQYLLQRGADVNAHDQHGITPILAAIWEGHTNAVKLLLSSGASKQGTAPDGSSYTDCAEKPEIRQLLSA